MQMDAPEVQPSDFSLAVDQTPLSLAIAGSVDVPVTITRGSGFTDTVALTATGLPTGVTATFNPASLPDGTNATTMTLTIDKSAGAGTSTITVTATAGTLTHSGTTSLELHTQTISGHIRYDLQNTTVRLVGQTAIMSDASGNFSFTDIKVPYDIYIVGQSGPDNAPIPTVFYYKGLTRTDPLLTAPATYCATGCLTIASSQGTVDGMPSSGGNTTDTIYAAWSSGGGGFRTDDQWYFTAYWGLFQSTVTGTLQVLQATRGTNSAPNGFYWGISPSVTINTGTNTINVALGSLATTADLTGTVTQPAGFPTPTLVLSQELNGYAFNIWQATTTNATSKIAVLQGQKATFYASTAASGQTVEIAYPALTSTTNVTTAMPAPAGLTGPVSGATGVGYSTPFNYTTTANQVYEVGFDNGTATFHVFTTDPQINIPNVPEMQLPSAASYTWTVTGYGPVTSVNGAADNALKMYVSSVEDDGAYHFMTRNPTRSFTTQ